VSAPSTSLPAIELDGVGKRYRLAERSLVQALRPSRRRAVRHLWAVRDLDLRVEPGETVGLLGHNGAGKSTLLRMMAGVSEPTTGRVTVRGRVAPLISVGVGFHQELTGRENVYVNGMLLGLTRAEVEARFDEIVDFAELRDRIDTPVKFYSSGMFMRLGFSVAVHVDPDVLLVDEVLAVGDVAFQLKCFDRMRELSARGTTIVLVSHSMHAIGLLCPRALLVQGGRLVFDGPSEQAIEEHHRLLALGMAAADGAEPADPVAVEAEVRRGEQPVARAEQDDELRVVGRVRFDAAVDDPRLVFRVVSEDGQLAYQYDAPMGHRHRSYRAGDVAAAEVRFRPALGAGGTFRLHLLVTDPEGRRVLGRNRDPLLLYVPPRYGVQGFADLEAAVSLDGYDFPHRPLTLGPGQPTGADAFTGAGER